MAGINYKKVAADVAAIIKDNGSLVEFDIRENGEYSPVNGIQPVIKKLKANAVLCKPTTDDTEATESTEAYLLVENKGNLTNASTVNIGGAQMEIVKVYPIRPNVVTVCAWKVWISS